MLRGMFIRLGLIAVAVWIVGGTIAGFSQSSVTQAIALGVPAAATLALIGLAFWALSRARSARGVASILADAQTPEDRKRAIEQLGKDFKKGDHAAVFAKAQLQLQEDPRAALETLEQIDVNKAMGAVADEARGQRGMIHLLLGEVSKARDLADGIDLSRHQDSRTKALLGSVVAEAWARTGQVKRAKNTIELFNPDDPLFEALRPQLYRARAFVFAYANNVAEVRKALRQLVKLDARILGGFLGKKVHPLLQKEAKVALEKSGQIPRRMQIERR